MHHQASSQVVVLVFKGSNSIFLQSLLLEVVAGIGGASATRCGSAGNGGSGGGGNGRSHPSGGAGNTPSVTPAQGFDGGAGSPAPLYAGGGGGGGYCCWNKMFNQMVMVMVDMVQTGFANPMENQVLEVHNIMGGGGGNGNHCAPSPSAGCRWNRWWWRRWRSMDQHLVVTELQIQVVEEVVILVVQVQVHKIVVELVVLV